MKKKEKLLTQIRVLRNIPRQFIAIILTYVMLISCGGGGGPVPVPAPTPSTTVNVSGAVAMPSGVQLDPKTLKIHGALNESTVGQGNSFNIPLNKGNVQAVAVLHPDGEPILMNILVGPTEGQSIIVDANTTATALIFLKPFLATSDPAIAESLLNYIKTLPDVQSIANIIKSKMITNPKIITAQDSEIRDLIDTAAAKVVSYIKMLSTSQQNKVALLNRILSQTTDLNKVGGISVNPESEQSGLKLIEISDASDVYKFKIRNGQHRFVDFYEMYPDGTGAYYYAPPIPFMVTLDPPGSWIPVIGQFQPKESAPLTIDLPKLGYNTVKIRAFGLGLYNWSALDGSDWSKWGPPIVGTVALNGVFPLIEIFTGTKLNIGSGRPLNNPLWKSLSGYLSEPETKAKLATYIVAKHGVGFIGESFKGYGAYLVSNPKYLHDLLIQQGLSIPLAMAKTALVFLRVVDVVDNGLQIMLTITDFYESEVVEDFIVYRDGGSSTIGPFPPFTPDPTDKIDLHVVQTIPPNNSVNVAPATNMSIFFDDQINPSTITDYSIQVYNTATGARYYGTYSGTLSQAGNTILNFVPYEPLPVNTQISVKLVQASGVQDKGGNTLTAVYSFQFTTGNATPVVNPGNWGFEIGTTGWTCTGDCNIVTSPSSAIVPTEGSKFASISTGSQIVSGLEASSGTTSTLTSGDIIVPTGKTKIVFDYNFVSAEFDEFVGSKYDDTFVIAISGSVNSYSAVVDSVNIIGVGGSQPVTLPNSYVNADNTLGGAEQSGFKTKSIDISNLGSPIRVSFSVSDVGDTSYSTIVFIDNLRFQ